MARGVGRLNLFPNNFQCSAVQRGWSAGIMYTRGLASLSSRGAVQMARGEAEQRGARVQQRHRGTPEKENDRGRVTRRRAAGGRGVTAILFSGVIFYQHRQPSALTNPSTPLRRLYSTSLSISLSAWPWPPLHLYPRPLNRLPLLHPGTACHLRTLCPPSAHLCHPLFTPNPPLAVIPGHPIATSSSSSRPTNLATVSVLNHICDAFFFLPLFS